MIFDPNHSDVYPNGQPVSVCTQYLSFLFSRRDKPDWLTEPRLDFIDLRTDANTLYFFIKRADKRYGVSQPFKLAGNEMPPELFNLVRSNFGLEDVGNVRQTTSSAADFPFDERACSTIRIDFNLNDGSTLEELLDFEARTQLLVQNMTRECNRAMHPIKRLVVNMTRNGDYEFFFQYALNSQTIQDLLATIEELEFVKLQLHRDLVRELDNLLGSFRQLIVRTNRLFLSVRSDQMPEFRFRDRLFINHVTCSSQTMLGDVRALTSNPIESTNCPETLVSDSDDDS